MPKKPIDYSNCVMYRLVCKDLNVTDCYVGHTTNHFKLKKRSSKHRTDYKIHKKIRVYKFIRENGGLENWDVIEIEKFPCTSFSHFGSNQA